MSTNTFSSTTKLGEYFAKPPACKADSTNWVFFRDRFLFSIDAAGLSDHFEDSLIGTAAAPVAPAVCFSALGSRGLFYALKYSEILYLSPSRYERSHDGTRGGIDFGGVFGV
jgi:hypothetical protein